MMMWVAMYPLILITAKILYCSPLVNIMHTPTGVPLIDWPHCQKIVWLSLLDSLAMTTISVVMKSQDQFLNVVCSSSSHSDAALWSILNKYPAAWISLDSTFFEMDICIVRETQSYILSRYIFSTLLSCLQIERTCSPLRICGWPAMYARGGRVDP